MTISPSQKLANISTHKLAENELRSEIEAVVYALLELDAENQEVEWAKIVAMIQTAFIDNQHVYIYRMLCSYLLATENAGEYFKNIGFSEGDTAKLVRVLVQGLSNEQITMMMPWVEVTVRKWDYLAPKDAADDERWWIHEGHQKKAEDIINSIMSSMLPKSPPSAKVKLPYPVSPSSKPLEACLPLKSACLFT